MCLAGRVPRDSNSSKSSSEESSSSESKESKETKVKENAEVKASKSSEEEQITPNPEKSEKVKCNRKSSILTDEQIQRLGITREVYDDIQKTIDPVAGPLDIEKLVSPRLKSDKQNIFLK